MEEVDHLCFLARGAVYTANHEPSDETFTKAKKALNAIHTFLEGKDILLRGAIEVRLERPEYHLKGLRPLQDATGSALNLDDYPDEWGDKPITISDYPVAYPGRDDSLSEDYPVAYPVVQAYFKSI